MRIDASVTYFYYYILLILIAIFLVGGPKARAWADPDSNKKPGLLETILYNDLAFSDETKQVSSTTKSLFLLIQDQNQSYLQVPSVH